MMEVSLFQTISQKHHNGTALLIGMDGMGGAGKSTISEKLYKELKRSGYPVTLFHIDHFIHPRAVRYNDNYSPWECYYDLQWRYEYLLNEILLPLKNGSNINKDIELYDLEQDNYRSVHFEIPAGSIVIVEGIFLQRKELKGIFDFTIYVDIPENVRLERVLKRDGYIGNDDAIREKYETRYFPAERYYISEYSPAEKADLVI